MRKREKCNFISTLNEGKPEEQHVKVDAWAIRNGLAVGHAVKLDSDNQAVYEAGWVIYHRASGRIVKSAPHKHKTPADALRYVREEVKGLIARLKAWQGDYPVCDCTAEVLGKLKSFPKPKGIADKPRAGCERVDAKKFAGFLQLIDQVDAARREAYRTSEKQVTFQISWSRFTVGASLDALNLFRMRLLKNRAAFADKCFQNAPVISECAKVAVTPECALSEVRKVELSERAAQFIAESMRKVKFNPKFARVPAVSFAAIN